MTKLLSPLALWSRYAIWMAIMLSLVLHGSDIFMGMVARFDFLIGFGGGG